jgi:hypothetical protein
MGSGRQPMESWSDRRSAFLGERLSHTQPPSHVRSSVSLGYHRGYVGRGDKARSLAPHHSPRRRPLACRCSRGADDARLARLLGRRRARRRGHARGGVQRAPDAVPVRLAGGVLPGRGQPVPRLIGRAHDAAPWKAVRRAALEMLRQDQGHERATAAPMRDRGPLPPRQALRGHARGPRQARGGSQADQRGQADADALPALRPGGVPDHHPFARRRISPGWWPRSWVRRGTDYRRRDDCFPPTP